MWASIERHRMRRRTNVVAAKRALPSKGCVSGRRPTQNRSRELPHPSSCQAVLFHASSSIISFPPNDSIFARAGSCSCIRQSDNGWPAVSLPPPGLENGVADAVAIKPVCATFQLRCHRSEVHFDHIKEVCLAVAGLLDLVSASNRFSAA